MAIFLKKKAIESLLDAVASNLSKAMQCGVEHPALKLVKTNGRRRWKDEEEAAMIIEYAAGENAYKKKLIGIVEAEKIVGKEAIASLTEVGEGKIELVSVNDKREGLLISKLEELE